MKTTCTSCQCCARVTWKGSPPAGHAASGHNWLLCKKLAMPISLGFLWILNVRVWHVCGTYKNLCSSLLSPWWEGTMYTYVDHLPKVIILKDWKWCRMENQSNYHTPAQMSKKCVTPQDRIRSLGKWLLPPEGREEGGRAVLLWRTGKGLGFQSALTTPSPASLGILAEITRLLGQRQTT